jgi:hypothetical protein
MLLAGDPASSIAWRVEHRVLEPERSTPGFLGGGSNPSPVFLSARHHAGGGRRAGDWTAKQVLRDSPPGTWHIPARGLRGESPAPPVTVRSGRQRPLARTAGDVTSARAPEPGFRHAGHTALESGGGFADGRIPERGDAGVLKSHSHIRARSYQTHPGLLNGGDICRGSIIAL